MGHPLVERGCGIFLAGHRAVADSSAAFGFGMTRFEGMNAWHFAMQPLALHCREFAFCKMDGIEESEQFVTIQLSVCAHA